MVREYVGSVCEGFVNEGRGHVETVDACFSKFEHGVEREVGCGGRGWTAAQARLRRVEVSEVMWWRRGEQRWTISSRALASRMVHVRVGNWDPYCAIGRYRRGRGRGSEIWWPRTRRMAEMAWVSSARHFSRV